MSRPIPARRRKGAAIRRQTGGRKSPAVMKQASGGPPPPEQVRATNRDRVASTIDLAANILSILIFSASLITVGFTVFLMVSTYTPMPRVDHWWLIRQVANDRGGYSWHDLWALHNEHRPVFPRLFFLTDLFVFRGLNIFLLASIVIIQLAHAALLSSVRRIFQGGFRSVEFMSAGVVLFAVFNPVQRDNFQDAWEVAYVLPFFCTTLAFVFMAAHKREFEARGTDAIRSKWVWASLGAAAVASLSLLSGILTWPLLCMEAIALRLQRRIVFLSAGAGALVSAAIFIGFRRHAALGAYPTLRQTPAVLSYIFELFTFDSAFPTLRLSMFLVISAAMIVVLLYLRAMWSGRSTIYSVVLLSVAWYAVICAVMISIGRLHLPLAGRYFLVPALFWCACVLLLIEVLSAAPTAGGRYGLIALQTVTLIAFVASWRFGGPLVDEARQLADELRRAETAVVVGVNDTEASRRFLFNPKWVLPTARYLRKTHRSMFSRKAARAVGERLPDLYHEEAGACSGDMVRANSIVDPARPGLRVVGWGLDGRSHAALQQVLLVTADKRVVGYAEHVRRVPDAVSGWLEMPQAWNVYVPSQRNVDAVTGWREMPQAASWLGYTTSVRLSESIAAYGVLSDDLVCPLGAPRDVRALKGSPPPLESERLAGLVSLWSPDMPAPVPTSASVSIKNGLLAVTSHGTDPQLLFTCRRDLRNFKALVFKVYFQRQDSVELFFGMQVNGRGFAGQVPVAGEWLYVVANVSLNPFWKGEADNRVRFDPTGALGEGAVTRIASIQGSEVGFSDARTPFVFYEAEER